MSEAMGLLVFLLILFAPFYLYIVVSMITSAYYRAKNHLRTKSNHSGESLNGKSQDT